MLVLSSLTSAIKDCLYRDVEVQQALQSIDLIALRGTYCLKLISRPNYGNVINNKLIWIVRSTLSIVPESQLKEVMVDGTMLSLNALFRLCPKAATPLLGSNDSQLVQSYLFQRRGLYDAAIEALRDNHTVFLLSANGRYEDVHFHRGIATKLNPEDLIGKYLPEILGEASADTVMDCLAQAQRRGIPQECFYDVRFADGEQRWYRGKAYPSSGNDLFLFLVNRVGNAKE